MKVLKAEVTFLKTSLTTEGRTVKEDHRSRHVSLRAVGAKVLPHEISLVLQYAPCHGPKRIKQHGQTSRRSKCRHVQQVHVMMYM